jgi:phosphoglycerate kinase
MVRPDLNVSVENRHIKNPNQPHARVVAAAETLKELAEKGAKVVVTFHQGRPNDLEFMDTPYEHAKQLEALTGRTVKVVDDLFGPQAIEAIRSLKEGEILVLKPVRAKDPSTGKTLEENPYFNMLLEPYIDLFVLDGFSVAHRDSPSVTGFTRTPTVAGRLMAKEIRGASKLLHPDQPSLLVVGGGKVDEKFTQLRSDLTSG